MVLVYKCGHEKFQHFHTQERNYNFDMYINKLKHKTQNYSFQVHLILFIFLYALFALDRIKKTLSFTVDGIAVTNEIWIIVLIYLLTNMTKKKGQTSFYKYNFYFGILLFLYMIVIVMGAFNADSISQYIYATLLFIIPTSLFFMTSGLTSNDIDFLLKIIVATCLFYATFAIILTTNYAFFMSLVGNPVDDYRYYSQYRASMMLGSSITVSYYLNLTLPLCFYLFFTSKDRKWRNISALAITVNIAASFVLLSRAAALCTIFIIIINLLFVKSDIEKNIRKLLLVILIIVAGIYLSKNYDLSRLAMGFDTSGSSIAARLTASNLGLYIFSKYPIFGSGLGKYFKRVYDCRYIIIDGIEGLIDPHNMYVLILSETGLIGLIVVIMMFLILFKCFSHIKEIALRQTAYITLFAFLFDAMGGSHLFNEISYSIIFWVYMGLFNAISIKDRINMVDLRREKAK